MARRLQPKRHSQLPKKPNFREEQLQNRLTPAPRSIDERTRRLTRSAGVDKHSPNEKQLNDYWDLYETNEIVQASIDAFAREVIAPGIQVEANSEADAEELERWLEDSAILNGEPGKSFTALLKDVIIQREVRGTALIEKVPDVTDPEALYGFKPIPVNTVKHYTRPGQSLLLDPNDTNNPNIEVPDKNITEDGEAAAYIQFDDSIAGFSFEGQDEILFTRDEIIKVVRDADVGAILGTSRLKPIEDRINSLEDKLDNNDKAIESMAWKFWLIKFGDEETPWDPEDIDSFMSNHTSSEFEPGMKQGVQGDVSIDTVKGEVAEGLEEFLDFDINMILANLPVPKFALGAFEENVNQFVSRSQEARLLQQVREARRELEDEFTPVVREKAEELGIAADDVKLVIEDEDPVADMTRPPASAEQDGPVSPDDGPTADDEGSVWGYDDDVEELQSTFIAAETERTELRMDAEDVLLSVRDTVLDRLQADYPASTTGNGRGTAPRSIDRAVNSAVTTTLRQKRIQRRAMPRFEAIAGKTKQRVAEQVDDVSGGVDFGDQTSIRLFADDFKMSIENAAEEMAGTVRTLARNAMESGDGVDLLTARVEDRFNERNIRQKSSVIAHMESRKAVESLRLREYEASSEVIGVRPVNDCDADTTPLCRNLAGCGDQESAEALFDDGDVAEQLQAHTDESTLFKGFSPLPKTPPFHFNCTTQLDPIFSTEEEMSDTPDEG